MNISKTISKYNTTDKKIWGPHYWFMIHNFAANYPETPNIVEIEVAANFIRSLPILLPCSECAAETHSYVEKYNKEDKYIENYIVNTKNNLIIFFIRLHDFVNLRLNKPTLNI